MLFKNDSVKILSRDALNGKLVLLLEFELSPELVVAVGSRLGSVLASLFAPQATRLANNMAVKVVCKIFILNPVDCKLSNTITFLTAIVEKL